MQTLLPSGQIVFDEWYASEEGQWLLAATDRGAFMFVWEAVYSDGKSVRQFDEVAWLRCMTDEDYAPPEGLRLSVDALDKERVSQFRLIPTAMTRKRAPWFQRPISVALKLGRGERFVSHWLTDYTPKTGYRVRRQVIGFERVVGEVRVQSVVVVSPSGAITIAGDTDQSFEGE